MIVQRQKSVKTGNVMTQVRFSDFAKPSTANAEQCLIKMNMNFPKCLMFQNVFMITNVPLNIDVSTDTVLSTVKKVTFQKIH